MARTRRTAALAIVIALALPAAAGAATTVSYAPGTGLQLTGDDSSGAILATVSGSGGDDAFGLTPPVVYVVWGFDPVAGAGCVAGTAKPHGQGGATVTGVKCEIPNPIGPGDNVITAATGGGDDSVFVANLTTFNVPARATYDMGAGNDRVTSLLGDDTTLGGSGDDLMQAGPPGGITGADTFEGGTGRDRVNYGDRTAGVSVTPTGPDGEQGENDNIKGDVEEFTGGSGNDVLALELSADGADGTVSGGNGDDVLSARVRGIGTLNGGLGVDKLQGGSRRESILARDGIKDDIACGLGEDQLDADLKDPLDKACERVTQGAIKEGPNVRIRTARAQADRRRGVAVRLACPRKLMSLGCRGTLGVGTSGRKTRYRIRSGRSKVVRARLSAREARRLRTARRSLRAASVERGIFGSKTTWRSVVVRASRR